MQTLEDRLFSAQNNYYVATATDLFSAPQLMKQSANRALETALETDCLIIGGGLAGLATGMSLLERGEQKVTVIESRSVGYGASGRNGGFVFGGYSLGEAQLLHQLGEKDGRWAYELTTAAVETLRTRIERYAIECDKRESGIVLADGFTSSRPLKAKQQWMQRSLGVDWSWLDRERLQQHVTSARYHHGLLEQNAFHIHPLKYVKGLARAFVEKGGSCYEHTAAQTIEPYEQGVRVTTDQ